MSKIFRIGWRAFCVVLILLIAACNARLYTPAPERNSYRSVDATLDHFASRLDAGLATEMQSLFPEGLYFSYALYGLARINLAKEGVDVEANLAEAQAAYQALDSDEARLIFSPTLEPPYGIFYQGWRNYLLAAIVAVQQDPGADEMARFEQQSAQIAAALASSPHPFLSAYPRQTWPVDTFPAVASLRSYSTLVDDQHEAVISEWLAAIDRYRDPATGLLPHQIAPTDGQILDGARATSQTLMLRFLAEIEPEIAQKDYAVFRDLFMVNRFGFPGVLEYPKGSDGVGDVDSGPLITGVSLSATAVMLGTARTFGDEALAKRLWQSAEAVGVPYPTANGRQYAASLPFEIGNVFAAWSASTARVDAAAVTLANDSAAWWLPFHLLSLVCCALIYLAGFRIFLGHSKK